MSREINIAMRRWYVIPEEMVKEGKLSFAQMFIWAEIHALSHGRDCTASNNYFCKVFKMHPSTISAHINAVIQSGYAELVGFDGHCRRLRSTVALVSAKRGTSKSEGVSRIGEPSSLLNSTMNNITPISPKGDAKKGDNKDDVRSIIDYLNKTVGKDFKTFNKKTAGLIRARLNEGYTVAQFEEVINKKWDKWKDAKSSSGTPMSDYMRPQTLFGNKFEGYLNESWNSYDDPSDLKGWKL